MTKVKICGMMRPEDIEAAKEADYLGFVVESNSRRSLSLQVAKELMSTCSNEKVVVTSSADIAVLERIAMLLEPEILQVHSLLSPMEMRTLTGDCECKIWALVPVGHGHETRRARALSGIVDAILLDTHGYMIGGSGKRHDWSVSRDVADSLRPFPVVLAGGLDPDNVEGAIVKVRPFAVDVSSGVEVEGRKRAELVREFIIRARGAGA